MDFSDITIHCTFLVKRYIIHWDRTPTFIGVASQNRLIKQKDRFLKCRENQNKNKNEMFLMPILPGKKDK